MESEQDLIIDTLNYFKNKINSDEKQILINTILYSFLENGINLLKFDELIKEIENWKIVQQHKEIRPYFTILFYEQLYNKTNNYKYLEKCLYFYTALNSEQSLIDINYLINNIKWPELDISFLLNKRYKNIDWKSYFLTIFLIKKAKEPIELKFTTEKVLNFYKNLNFDKYKPNSFDEILFNIGVKLFKFSRYIFHLNLPIIEFDFLYESEKMKLNEIIENVNNNAFNINEICLKYQTLSKFEGYNDIEMNALNILENFRQKRIEFEDLFKNNNVLLTKDDLLDIPKSLLQVINYFKALNKNEHFNKNKILFDTFNKN
jgi:hypothetical protein